MSSLNDDYVNTARAKLSKVEPHSLDFRETRSITGDLSQISLGPVPLSAYATPDVLKKLAIVGSVLQGGSNSGLFQRAGHAFDAGLPEC